MLWPETNFERKSCMPDLNLRRQRLARTKVRGGNILAKATTALAEMLPPVIFVLARRYRPRFKSTMRLFLSKFSLPLTQSAFLLLYLFLFRSLLHLTSFFLLHKTSFVSLSQKKSSGRMELTIRHWTDQTLSRFCYCSFMQLTCNNQVNSLPD